jgi:hypothetical protein
MNIGIIAASSHFAEVAMEFSGRFVTSLFVLLALSASAAAQTGQEGWFNIYNNTSENVVVGFYTSDGDDWSSNWLADEINPGEHAQAEFLSDSGNCDQYLMVGWLGEGDTEILDDAISIDICVASNVYLGDNEIYFD